MNCEWNPVEHDCHRPMPRKTDCHEPAVFTLGHNYKFHVCYKCASDPYIRKLYRVVFSDMPKESVDVRV